MFFIICFLFFFFFFQAEDGIRDLTVTGVQTCALPIYTCIMARYFALLGRRIEVQYRAGDMLLPAAGMLVADSGKSIFLEEHFCQRGTVKTFRWEIPYPCIVRLGEISAAPDACELASPASTEEAAVQAGLLPLKNLPEKD